MRAFSLTIHITQRDGKRPGRVEQVRLPAPWLSVPHRLPPPRRSVARLPADLPLIGQRERDVLEAGAGQAEISCKAPDIRL